MKEEKVFSKTTNSLIILGISLISILEFVVSVHYKIQIMITTLPTMVMFIIATVFYLFAGNNLKRSKARTLALYLLIIPFVIFVLIFLTSFLFSLFR